MTRTSRRLAGLAAPFLIALVVYGGALAVMRPVPNGDEPHYGLEAYSIARDGDRDLYDDYLDAERVSWIYRFGAPFEPHAFRFRADGPLVSYHGVGLPLLLAPTAAVARGWLYLRVTMVVIAALAAAVLFSILRALAPQSRWARWGVWALVAFSWPVLVYSNQIYPEVPGALAVLIAVRALLTPRPSTARIVVATTAAAYLPFLHVRLLPIALGLLAVVVVRTIALRRGDPRALLTGLAGALLPAAVAAVLLAVGFAHWYGSPLPTAPLRSTFAIPGPLGDASAGFDATSSLRQPVLDHVVPMFISTRQGWLPYAPWGLVALAGTLVLILRRNVWVAAGVLIAGGYLALVASSGVGVGASFPGRFSIVLLPLLAVPLLSAVRASRAVAGLTCALAVVCAVIVAGALPSSDGLYGDLSGRPSLAVGSALLRPWGPGATATAPSPPARRPAQDLDPALVAGPGRRVTCCGPRTLEVAGSGPGVVAMSRPTELWRGEYVAIFPLVAAGGAPAAPGDLGALRLDVGGRTYIDDRFDRRALPTSGLRVIARRFRTPGGVPVSAGVESLGPTTLRVGRPYFVAAAVTPPAGAQAPAPSPAAATAVAPLAVGQLWVILVAGLAAAMLAGDRLAARSPLASRPAPG